MEVYVNIILKPKILKNVKDVEYMDDFDDWYIFKENSSDYAELPKNMILYGPPGTGKTYHTLLYAVAVIEEKSLSDIVNVGLPLEKNFISMFLSVLRSHVSRAFFNKLISTCSICARSAYKYKSDVGISK